MDGLIGTPETIGQGRFTRTDDILTPGSGHMCQEVLEGAAKLVLRRTPDQWRRLGSDLFDEVLQHVVNQDVPLFTCHRFGPGAAGTGDSPRSQGADSASEAAPQTGSTLHHPCGSSCSPSWIPVIRS